MLANEKIGQNTRKSPVDLPSATSTQFQSSLPVVLLQLPPSFSHLVDVQSRNCSPSSKTSSGSSTSMVKSKLSVTSIHKIKQWRSEFARRCEIMLTKLSTLETKRPSISSLTPCSAPFRVLFSSTPTDATRGQELDWLTIGTSRERRRRLYNSDKLSDSRKTTLGKQH